MAKLLNKTHFSTERVVPGFGRRVLALCYEFILLLGVWFVVSLLFHLVFRDPNAAYFRPLFQFYLLNRWYLFHLVLDAWWSDAGHADVADETDID